MQSNLGGDLILGEPIGGLHSSDALPESLCYKLLFQLTLCLMDLGDDVTVVLKTCFFIVLSYAKRTLPVPFFLGLPHDTVIETL